MNGDDTILLGIDFGSGGCKVSAIDCTGLMLGDASVEYATHYEHPGWSSRTPPTGMPPCVWRSASLRRRE